MDEIKLPVIPSWVGHIQFLIESGFGHSKHNIVTGTSSYTVAVCPVDHQAFSALTNITEVTLEYLKEETSNA